MKTKVITAICLVLLSGVMIHNLVAQEPNEPRKIVMPTGAKMPPKYVCPVHGIIEATLTLEHEGIKCIYCKKCAMKFMIDVFDLNLPELKKVK